jgi:hypothetical protein
MHRFVARQNVKRCRSRLETETDPTKRSVLLKLLVAEEDKLGRDYELLVEVEREIVKGDGRITRQEVIIDNLQHDGKESSMAKALLETFTLTQLAYADYRRKILAVIDNREF